jgi:hypothetical protein
MFGIEGFFLQLRAQSDYGRQFRDRISASPADGTIKEDQIGHVPAER